MKIRAYLLVLVLASCHSGNSIDHITLFNDVEFTLNPGEKDVTVNKFILDGYQKQVNLPQEIQIPLFHYVKSQDYEIYIGLPVSSDLSRYQNEGFFGHIAPTNSDSGDDFIWGMWNNNEKSISGYTFFKKIDNNVIFVLAIPKENIDPEKFTASAFNARFKSDQ